MALGTPITISQTPKITITILQTGNVKIRPSMLTQPATRSIFLRRLRFLTDRTWTSPLPIYVFLISHPDGHILFDTGLSPHCNDPGYSPWWMPTFGLTSSMSINSNEGVAMQLKNMGIEPKDLMAVVLSHLHHDHAGGLEDLIGVPTYMLEKHWEAFKNHIKATIEGAMPQHWPKNFAPKFLQADGGSVASFEKSYPITSDGKIVAIETPGHVPGHLSVIVWGDNGNGYMLMGDATYSLEALEKEETDGINADPFKAVETLKKIKELARQKRIVVLPAHEEDAVRRLREGVLYVPTML